MKEGGKGPRLCYSYLDAGLTQVWGRCGGGVQIGAGGEAEEEGGRRCIIAVAALGCKGPKQAAISQASNDGEAERQMMGKGGDW